MRSGVSRRAMAGLTLIELMIAMVLGLVVLDVANPFFTDVAKGVEDATAAEFTDYLLETIDRLRG